MDCAGNSKSKELPDADDSLERDVAQLSGDIESVLATLESMKVDFERNSIPGEAANDVPQGVVGKKKRTRVRKNKNRTSEGSLEESDNLSVNSVAMNAAVRQELLSNENLLILQLLSMTPDEREQYLMQIALEREILLFIRRGKQKNIMVNPVIYNYLKSNQHGGDLAKIQTFLGHGAPSRDSRDNHHTPRRSIQQQREERGAQKGKKDKKGKKKDKKKPSVELSDLEEKYLKLVEQEVGGVDKPIPPSLTGILIKFGEMVQQTKRGQVVEGEIRVSSNNYHNAFMANPSGGKDIIFRSSILRRHALPGDRVLALIFKTTVRGQDVKADTSLEDNDDAEDAAVQTEEEVPEIEEREVGVVLDILEQVHNRLIVGTFQHPISQRNLLTPRDIRLPRVRVEIKDVVRALGNNVTTLKNFIFLAKITHCTYNDVHGQLLKIIGQVGELQSENRAILVANDLNPEPYPEEILANLPNFDVGPKDFDGRTDLRRTCIFTIDPATARDLDDAMSCRRMDDGTYEVGVHIADVAHFIPENSPLDEILRKKTTSIYMVNAVYHMLPLQMCLGLSLLPGKDRLAFSVFWRMDAEGKILEERIAKTVINSCTQLAYSHAQEIIDHPEEDPSPTLFPAIHSDTFTLKDITESVRILHRLSRKLRAKRFDGGAVKLDQPKITFVLDPQTGLPKEFHTEVIQESNQLIEEFMLLANMTVARWTHEKFPTTAVLRCHNEPDRHQIDKLAKDFKTHGVEFDLSSTSAISASLEKAIEACKDTVAAKTVLTCMLTKPMRRARYFCSGMTESEDEFRHYLLSIPIYTHFTSPIRRYPDILVHRLLAAAECGAPVPQLPPEEIHSIAAMCNVQKYNAKLAGNDSIDLYFNKFVEAAKSVKMRAAVFRIGLKYADVILIDTGHHVKATYGKGKATYKENITPRTVVITREKSNTTMVVSVFSECNVSVTYEDGKLKGKLVWPSNYNHAPPRPPNKLKEAMKD
ncbi:DIS3-like exonuclease 2 [Lutzomyia longipalpis]|uniref:DIS3-like exonuclease 2 n=1 Tax=Lutzomyia longipalpis TaxID=7200 RepID=UPI0024845AF2|nr:DIS3-like exonuclease 2 [Lutzomyia longipalpis]